METIKNATGMGSQAQGPEHSEEEKRQIYSNLSDEEKSKQTYTEWAKEAYHDQYEKWMPWIEDQYLRWFGKGDNKASYATKGNPQNLPLPLIHEVLHGERVYTDRPQKNN